MSECFVRGPGWATRERAVWTWIDFYIARKKKNENNISTRVDDGTLSCPEFSWLSRICPEFAFEHTASLKYLRPLRFPCREQSKRASNRKLMPINVYF